MQPLSRHAGRGASALCARGEGASAAQACLFALACAALACGGRSAVQDSPVSSLPGVSGSTATAKGLYATLVTEAGEIELRLLRAEAPQAAERFAALARGEGTRRPLYDGARFERATPGFVIQCAVPDRAGVAALVPLPGRVFNRPGVAAFAGDASAPVGGQFFITLAAAPWLDGRHAAFGEIVRGLDAARAIAAAPRLERDADGVVVDRPLKPVRIVRVRVEER
ncbi:MAG: peptidylprolyl isomerase [Elusimicrobiota bacterium]